MLLTKAAWQEFAKKLLDKIDFRTEYENLGLRVTGADDKSVQGYCPLHEDAKPSFSFFLDSGQWKCFAGCGGGSFSDFAMRKLNLDYKETVLHYAQKLDVQPPALDEPPSKPAIKPELTEKYHQQLLAAKDKLDWLITGKRGFTMDAIKRFQVGWNGKKYTLPVLDENKQIVNIRLYTPEAKDTGKMSSYTSGEFRYGEVRLYGLDQLVGLPLSVPIILCEGEHDRIVLEQNGICAVTGTGGAGVFKKDWPAYFENRNLYICYDNDDPGRAGAKNAAILLAPVAASLRIIALPNSVGPKGDITDYFVRIGHSAEDFQALMVEAPEYKHTAQAPAPEAGPVTYIDDPIQTIGTNKDKRIVLFSSRNKTIFDYDANGISRRSLVQMAGLEYVRRIEGDEFKSQNRRINAYIDQKISDASLVMLATKQTAGTGLHKYSDDELLLVSGREAYIIGRDLSMKEIISPVFGQFYVQFSSDEESFFYPSMIETAKTMTPTDANKICVELFTIIDNCWQFRDPYDVLIVTGMIIASILQSTWHWKPLVWLTSASQGGKTQLLNLLCDLFGSMALISDDASLAGIVSTMNNKALVLLLDEQEKNKGHRASVMAGLRSINSRGARLRGKQTAGEAVQHRLSSICWMAAIDAGNLEEAGDASRFIQINIEKFKAEPPSLDALQEMSHKLYSLAFYLYSKGADKKAKDLRKIGFEGVYASRQVANVAPVVSTMFLCNDGKETEADILSLVLSGQTGAKIEEVVSDELGLFHEILKSIVQIETQPGRKTDFTVLEVIESNSIDTHKQLERKGIGVKINIDGTYLLKISQREVRKYILFNTKWKDTNIKSVLDRLPGAYRTKENMQGENKIERKNAVNLTYPLVEEACENE